MLSGARAAWSSGACLMADGASRWLDSRADVGVHKLITLCGPARMGLIGPGGLNGADAGISGRCTGVMHPVGTDRVYSGIWPIWPYALCLVFVNLN